MKETQKQSKYIIWLVQAYKNADGEQGIFNKKTRREYMWSKSSLFFLALCSCIVQNLTTISRWQSSSIQF